MYESRKKWTACDSAVKQSSSSAISASAIKLLQFTVELWNMALHKSFIHSFIHSDDNNEPIKVLYSKYYGLNLLYKDILLENKNLHWIAQGIKGNLLC